MPDTTFWYKNEKNPIFIQHKIYLDMADFRAKN